MECVGRAGIAALFAALLWASGPASGAPGAPGPAVPARPEVPAAEGLPLNPVEAAGALWKAYAEKTDLDARTDLLQMISSALPGAS